MSGDLKKACKEFHKKLRAAGDGWMLFTPGDGKVAADVEFSRTKPKATGKQIAVETEILDDESIELTGQYAKKDAIKAIRAAFKKASMRDAIATGQDDDAIPPELQKIQAAWPKMYNTLFSSNMPPQYADRIKADMAWLEDTLRGTGTDFVEVDPKDLPEVYRVFGDLADWLKANPLGDNRSQAAPAQQGASHEYERPDEILQMPEASAPPPGYGRVDLGDAPQSASPEYDTVNPQAATPQSSYGVLRSDEELAQEEHAGHIKAWKAIVHGEKLKALVRANKLRPEDAKKLIAGMSAALKKGTDGNEQAAKILRTLTGLIRQLPDS